jgi:hypothetical protein
VESPDTAPFRENRRFIATRHAPRAQLKSGAELTLADLLPLGAPRFSPYRGYTPSRGPAWPRILTVWLSCSIFSGFFNTVTGLICKIRSRTSESG